MRSRLPFSVPPVTPASNSLRLFLGLAQMRPAIAILLQVLQSLKLCHRSSDEQIAVG
ncbi:MAG: hypothetical protein ACKN9A_19500 [Microcystis aeruginosa]